MRLEGDAHEDERPMLNAPAPAARRSPAAQRREVLVVDDEAALPEADLRDRNGRPGDCR
jgi:hypothetical protein